MPKLRPDQLPKLHRRKDGLACAQLSGESFYFGPWGDDPKSPNPEVVTLYREAIARWEARGRRCRPKPKAMPAVAALCDAYIAHVRKVYRKRDKITMTGVSMTRVAERVKSLYGTMRTSEFGPDEFRIVRETWVEAGCNRQTVNRYGYMIVAMFRWGFEDAPSPFVPDFTVTRLRAVRSLRQGRTIAPEPNVVEPVPREHVDAVLAVAKRRIVDMIHLQLLTGMRPGEVCAMRPKYIERAVAEDGRTVWWYRVPPDWNKTSHLCRTRSVPLGPRAQVIVGRYLETRGPNEPFFRSQKTGGAYSPRGYTIQLHNLCRRVGIPIFGANRLRHLFATEIRRKYDIETAREFLGHKDIGTTQRYAKPDPTLSAKAAAEIG
jgi:integrase